MEYIRSSSKIWRATCSFPTYKSDIYRDYVRAQISVVDILTFIGNGCRKVEQVNIRVHHGMGTTMEFWQASAIPFHVESSIKPCDFDSTVGSISSEGNFGYYAAVNKVFRCTESDESTTQYWFGVNV